MSSEQVEQGKSRNWSKPYPRYQRAKQSKHMQEIEAAARRAAEKIAAHLDRTTPLSVGGPLVKEFASIITAELRGEKEG